METFGEIMVRTYAPERGERPVEQRESDPDLLPPDVAASLGSQLVQGGNYRLGIKYLRSSVQRVPTSFAWSRIGHALSRSGLPDGAHQAYRRALAIEPLGQFAVVGSANAAAERRHPPLADLVEAVEELVAIRGLLESRRYLGTLRAIIRAIRRQVVSPELDELIRTLDEMARQADRRTPSERTAALERRIDHALRAAELLGRPADGTRSNDSPAPPLIEGRGGELPTAHQAAARS